MVLVRSWCVGCEGVTDSPAPRRFSLLGRISLAVLRSHPQPTSSQPSASDRLTAATRLSLGAAAQRSPAHRCTDDWPWLQAFAGHAIEKRHAGQSLIHDDGAYWPTMTCSTVPYTRFKTSELHSAFASISDLMIQLPSLLDASAAHQQSARGRGLCPDCWSVSRQ